MIRLFDALAAALLLAALAPALAVIALAVRLESPGPAIFRQRRSGRGGVPFTMWKFRTMRSGAPVREAALQIEDFDAFVYAPTGRRDSRITRLGALLRATSLDELPQLVNVVRGEMSLVGPRPELEELTGQYPEKYLHRLDVPPGITGLAQVSGRADLSYGETMAYDLEYVARRSLGLNIQILARTLAAVTQRRGAR